MLQKPLPLLLVLPPLDSRLQAEGPRLPVRTLFDLNDRVSACFFPTAPTARIAWNPSTVNKKNASHARTYSQAVKNRLAFLAATPGLRAGVHCSLSALPLEGAGDEVAGKLAVYNHGDEYGEEHGGGPVTCPADVARDLRDLAAARLADWPGSVALNRGLAGDAFIAGRRKADQLAWVHLEFSSHLWMKPDGRLLNKRVGEFAGRLESILTLWCRLQSW
jgi:hypothetical protein